MATDTPTPRRDRDQPRWTRTATRVVVGAAGAACVLVGMAMAGLTMLLGHCSAFGGRCPDNPGPLLDNDVFGGVVGGLALATLPIVVWRCRSWRARMAALALAVPTWVVLGLVAVDWAAG